MTKYGVIITNAGDSLINEHVLAGNAPFIADGWSMAVGTGEVALEKETSSLVNAIFDKNSPDYNGISFGTDAKYGRYAEISIPQSLEGVIIKEVGLFNENNVLIAVASTDINLTETIENGILNSFKARISLLNIPSNVLILYTPQANLLTEEILQTTLEDFVKKDGTTPFLDEQLGVDPVSPKGLVTKNFYENNLPKFTKPFLIESGNLDSAGNGELLSGVGGPTLSFKTGDGAGANLKPVVFNYADKSQETLTSLASITNFIKKYSSIVPAMTSATTPSGYVVSASSYYDGSWLPYFAFDKNLASGWANSNSQYEARLQIDIPVAKVAKYSKLTTFYQAPYLPTNYSIYGSNDGGITKDVLYSYTGVLNVSTTYGLKLNNNLPYTTYGITIRDSNGGTEVHVNELDFFEENPSGTVYFDETYAVIKEKGQNPIAVLASTVTQGKILPTPFNIGDRHCLTATTLNTVIKNASGLVVDNQYVKIGECSTSNGIITGVSTQPYGQNGYEVNVHSNEWSKAFPNYAKRTPKANDTVYQAECDGYVIATASYNQYRGMMLLWLGETSTPGYLLDCTGSDVNSNTWLLCVKGYINKGEYYKVQTSEIDGFAMNFIPAKGAN